MRLRVIAVGSGVGDDAVAPAVLAWLAAQPEARSLSLVTCERPLPDLVDALADADGAIVIDAACGAGPPGSVRAIDEDAIATEASASSHGFGARRAVALARALDRAPQRIVWIAIAIDAPVPGAALSAAVRAAVPRAGALVLEEISRFGPLAPEASADA